MLLKETSRKFLTFFLELNCLLYSRFWGKQNKEESRFFEPPCKKQIGSNYREVSKSGVRLKLFTVEGKLSLVRIIGNSEKQSVR